MSVRVGVGDQGKSRPPPRPQQPVAPGARRCSPPPRPHPAGAICQAARGRPRREPDSCSSGHLSPDPASAERGAQQFTVRGTGTADRFMMTLRRLAWARSGRAGVQAKRRAAGASCPAACPGRGAPGVGRPGSPLAGGHVCPLRRRRRDPSAACSPVLPTLPR